MKIAFYDTHSFEQGIFEKLNKDFHHEIIFLETRLSEKTANTAKGCPVVCAFVNDVLSEETLSVLKAGGTKLIALRSAGFNHVNLKAAKSLQLRVVRVPEYSPHAVAEHAMALILCLNRKLHRSYNRIRESNFSLNGLVGFDLYKKTVGIIGTGKIGSVLCKILLGFGCHVIAYDIKQSPELIALGVNYVSLPELFKRADIISLHAPLNAETKHLVNEDTLSLTKPGVMIINTGRGALIETSALIKSLKSNHIGFAGLDVYEEEEGVFFEDMSGQILQDDQLARLITFPNVLITSHQAFLTSEALENIATTTLENIKAFENNQVLVNEVV